MGISRYVSRRYITLLKYILFAGAVYILYGAFSASTSSRSNEIRIIGRADRIEVPGGAVKIVPEQSDGVDPFVNYKSEPKKIWEDHEEYKKDQARVGPGEQGKPVTLPKDANVEQEALALYK
ncbi:hypothetical protein GCK32_013125, partial [Trichostrongylus colubriformis]